MPLTQVFSLLTMVFAPQALGCLPTQQVSLPHQ
jgi:hypothetical protein